jgi:hypothetical protein
MNEFITSLLVVFSQLGVVLAMAAVIVIFLLIRRKQKDNSLCKKFIELLKQKEGSRKDSLTDALKKIHQMDDDTADKTAKSMLNGEKKIYNHVLKLFMGHDRDSLVEIQKDVEMLASAYRKLITTAENTSATEHGESPKHNAQMRATIRQLTAERDKLQEDLDEAMQSMESMLKEYTQMYSGGGAKKEGLKHIENELGSLKQKIQNNVVELGDDDEEDIPDLTPAEQKMPPPENKE